MRQIPAFKQLIRRHFFSGVLIVIPIWIIGWILGWALSFVWGLHAILPEAWRPDSGFWRLLISAGVAVGVAVGISLVGWASGRYVGQKVLEFISDVIERIPVVRSVYSALAQLMQALGSGGGKQFNRVVYVEFPRKDCWTLAFVTGATRLKAFPPGYLNLFVPATPNPTAGFYLIVAESEVRESHMSVEEAFKVLLSLGIAQQGTSGEPGGR